MNRLLLTILYITIIYAPLTQAALIGIDNVYGENSLYTTDWGHSYNTGTGNEYNALGRGDPAEAWQDTAGHAYGFSSSDRILISASGCVVDLGTECTGPDYLGGGFRGLPVYSLIGIWSQSMTEISPVNNPFLVGSSLDLIVPDNGLSPLYLFLATNDGDFSDNYNHSNNTYSVSIEQLSNVPLPAAFWLMLSGLVFMRKLRKV